MRDQIGMDAAQTECIEIIWSVVLTVLLNSELNFLRVLVYF